MYFSYAVDVAVKWAQDLMFLILFEHLHSQRMFCQYFFQVDT